jgi:hypothetical protein
MIAPAFAAAPNWNITGAWDLNFVANVGAIGTYQHHMDVTQAPNGTLSGTGYYIPAPIIHVGYRSRFDDIRKQCAHKSPLHSRSSNNLDNNC